MPIQPGTRLGGYEVQEFLGQGAMGTVYKAHHPGLARTAAVKVLQNLDPDAETSARFQREAQAIAAMRHPNILNVYDFGEYEGSPYMIVEYMPGGSLADLARRGVKFSREQALERLAEIASALDYAHETGIVHRDVKPANVLTDGHGAAVLADFGLAKLMQSAGVKTVSGTTTGTPAYMSPEQVTGATVGPAADVYAFTTMTYEYLTGSIPFEGEGALELMYAHVQRVPPPASSRNPELPAEVDQVLARGLAKSPEERWQSCTAMLAGLRAALAGEPVSVAATARVPVLAPAAVSPEPAAPVAALPDPARAARRPRLGPRRLLAAAAVLLVAVLAALAAFSALAHKPALALSTTSVEAGGSITVTGSGYQPSENLDILIASDSPRRLTGATTGADGRFSVNVEVPAGISAGSHEIRVCNSHSSCQSSPLKVTHTTARPSPTPTRPAVTPSPVLNPAFTSAPNPLKIGAAIRVDGTGFASGKIVIELVQAGVPHAVGETDSLPNGSFSYQGIVPNSVSVGAALLRACNGPLPGTNCKDENVTITR